jgi:hypothetical protein
VTCTEKLAPEEVQRLLSNVREKEVNPQCRIDTSDIKTLRDAKVRASRTVCHDASCTLAILHPASGLQWLASSTLQWLARGILDPGSCIMDPATPKTLHPATCNLHLISCACWLHHAATPGW